MSTNEIKLPFGKISQKKLIMHFSAYDIDLPIIAAGIRERMDVFRELGVEFAGFGTDIPESMSEQSPALVKCFFEYVGEDGDANLVLKRVYHLVWGGMIAMFPDIEEWATAKADLSNLTLAQAEITRARKED